MDDRLKHKFDTIEPQIKMLCEDVAQELIFELYASLDTPQEEIDNMPVEKKIAVINKFKIIKDCLKEAEKK